MLKMPPFIICLMGPTASGKTAFAMEMIKHLPCDIISVDSAMVYHGMDIGTAKPTKEELISAPHYLVDIRDPADSYSVAQFYSDSLELIQKIHKQGRIPLLVGGTMMYFHSLQEGLAVLPASDENIRGQLDQECQSLGLEQMYARLKSVDSQSALRVSPQDWRRIQRALEVYYITGKTLTELIAQQTKEASAFPYSALNLAILPINRQLLRDKISERFLSMLDQGFIQEVEILFERKDKDLGASTPALQAAGYKQIWQYLQGNISKEDAQNLSITASCQLAKRQLTWLRHWKDIHYLASDSVLELLPKVLALINEHVKL